MTQLLTQGVLRQIALYKADQFWFIVGTFWL